MPIDTSSRNTACLMEGLAAVTRYYVAKKKKKYWMICLFKPVNPTSLESSKLIISLQRFRKII